MAEPLPSYRTRAVNSVRDSENRIHADEVALRYGFRAGLVAGVTVYGYMTEPIIARHPEWIECGTMQVRLLEPFYDGDQVIVKAESLDDGSVTASAEREDGKVCARATAIIRPASAEPPELIPEAALPARDQRPVATSQTVIPGALLGSVGTTLESASQEKLLQLSNDILIQNFRLGPWLHVSSELRNWGAAKAGEAVSVRGRVADRFDRKGHEFVVADVMVVAAGQGLLQTVRHTAIYRLRAA
jgi:hypothetical protein